MRIVAIACVKNERDVVEAFVRHTAALVDELVVMDNGSTDETVEILESLAREGLPLHIVHDPSPGYWQLHRMTRLMREQAIDRLGADWVVPVDADEFLALAPGATLFPLDHPSDRPLHYAWKTYVPDPRDNAGETNPALRIRHRLAVEAKTWFKTAVPAALARHPDASLAQGSHAFCLGGRAVKHLRVEHVHLAHFPGRSAAQLLAKIAIGHFQITAMKHKQPGWLFHYDAPFELIKQGPDAFAAGFRQLVLRYGLPPDEPFEPQVVEDPLRYAGGELRYTPPPADPSGGLRAVFDYVDDLAGRYAEASALLERLVPRRTVDEQNLDGAYDALIARLDRENRELRDTIAAIERSPARRAARAITGPAGRLWRTWVAAPRSSQRAA